MNVPELLDVLAQSGITLEALGDRLRYSPASRVSPELLDGLKAHKAELLAMLTNGLSHPISVDGEELADQETPELLDHATEWNADGWPADTVLPPPACGQCGSLDAWQSIAGPAPVGSPRSSNTGKPIWRCLRCDPPTTADRLRKLATRRASRGRAA